MGEAFRPFENFEHSQTPSLASRSKFSKEAKASTASRRLDEQSEVPNARIFKGDSGDFIESNTESLKDSSDSIESNDNIDCNDDNILDSYAMQSDFHNDVSINPHEVPQTLAPLRGAEKESKGGATASALFMQEAEKARLSPKSQTAAAVWLLGERGGGCKPLFAKESDSKNENISAESSRSERAENAESHKETLKVSSDFIDFIDSIESSDKMDYHANPCGLFRNDGMSVDFTDSIDCHELQSNSRNIDSFVFLRLSTVITNIRKNVK